MILTAIKKPNRSEREIAMELMNIGLGNGADAFSGTIGGMVLLKPLTFNYRSNPQHFRFPKLTADKSLVLTTEIKGDLPGVSFLVIDSESIDELGDRALPPSMRNLPPEHLPEMRKEMLLELDNIVTAAVVTRLADLLSVNIHGSVPKAEILSGEEMEGFLRKMSAKHRPNVAVTTQFNTPALPKGPRYYWFFKKEFVDSISKLNLDKGVKSLMEQTA